MFILQAAAFQKTPGNPRLDPKAVYEYAKNMARLNPLNDYLIVKMFGEIGDEEQLLSLANAVVKKTGKQFTSVQILADRTLTAEVMGNKKVILDVRSIVDERTRFDMEIQLQNQGNMIRRSLHYWSSDFHQSIGAGEDYRALPDVIAVNILNFPYIRLDAFHTSFHIYEDEHKDYKLTDALEIHFIDMPRFRKLAKKDMSDPLQRWLMFLDQKTEPDVLEEVVKMDRGIQRAQERMDFALMDREAYRQYEWREAQIFFYDQAVQQAAQEAAVQAAHEAAKNEKLEIARNLKSMGVPVEQISRGTNLSAEEIEGL